ncbi:hypothetical protein HK100_002446, partial [Physocladia obscura]
RTEKQGQRATTNHRLLSADAAASYGFVYCVSCCRGSFHSLSHSNAPGLGQTSHAVNRRSKRLQREVSDFQSLLTAEEERNDLDGYEVPDLTHHIYLEYDWGMEGSDVEYLDESDESEVEEEHFSQTPAPQIFQQNNPKARQQDFEFKTNLPEKWSQFQSRTISQKQFDT